MVLSETLTSEPPPITIMRRIWTGEAKAMWRMICSSASDLMRGNASHFRTKGFNTDQYRLGLVVDEELWELSQKKVSNLTDKINILCPCLLFGMNPPQSVCVCVWLCVFSPSPFSFLVLHASIQNSHLIPVYVAVEIPSIIRVLREEREKKRTKRQKRKQNSIQWAPLCFLSPPPRAPVPKHTTAQDSILYEPAGRENDHLPQIHLRDLLCPWLYVYLHNISVNVQSPLKVRRQTRDRSKQSMSFELKVSKAVKRQQHKTRPRLRRRW